MAEPSAPLLIFDSGVGGLTILAEVRRLLPDAPVIYAADFAGLPYGTKSEAEVAARVCGLLGRMAERYQPRLICIACNTASTIALGMVRDVLAIPIVGTVPAIKPAALGTQTGVIGLLGTGATVRQPYVDRLETEFAQDKRLIRHAADALVPLAEAKMRGEALADGAVAQAVAALRDHPQAADLDTLVLACTHFPLLADELRAVFGQHVRLVDGADGIARRIASLTQGQAFARERGDFAVATGSTQSLSGLTPILERHGLMRATQF
ncbi:glutamate racemase [Alteriqipengyuania lutimaris]|uniref:Glutamate racemase n=1 Tax=Alteriqipengyuania lutimaris TaxID=1538146 RepID=A0A395LMH7_9SPHN|nr:glutamate racemase [Alteriqipengyuania lutimaris]MBB3032642.1 glutamate racemase [Alteriqipengyuania lutimaris]RDS78243.1 glutamate racemase [Alteriqipengyuania lutimaris]